MADPVVSSPLALDKQRMREAFERAVDTYDGTAVLQREIAERMLSRLDLIKLKPKAILDAGCGTGHCARVLAKRYRRARILGIDIACAMVQRARRKAGWFSRSQFACGDIEALPLADASMDMVISNLTVQWCNPDLVFLEFMRVLRPDGLLMFTSFGPDTLRELKQAWSAVDHQTHVHAFMDMHDIGDVLIRTGFADPVMDVEHFTLTYKDVMGVMGDLKRLGAHNVARGRPRGLTGKTRFKRFKSAYASLTRDGLIPATYEAVYGHAWAPDSNVHGRDARLARGDGSVAIPVNRIGRRTR